MIKKAEKVVIVGGGLAGSEASWQLVQKGIAVTLYEMRPKASTPAHKTGDLAELVCSNSFKSESMDSASSCLKSEMTSFNSLVLQCAKKAQIPAGQALAVDREVFSASVTSKLMSHPLFTLKSEEVLEIPSEQELIDRGEYWIIASGPLTSSSLMRSLEKLCDQKSHLYFYDAIAPVIDADSIDMSKCFWGSRYSQEDGDYLNIPLTKDEYETFITDILEAEKTTLHTFEDPIYFESCLPIEVMAERGRETLRFGPMKPVGLFDPHTNSRPYANIQLRKENEEASMLSMVGFQSKMKWPEQKRVLSKIPALKNMQFFRYGSIHRNTYIESPKVLHEDLSFRTNSRVFPAGQITGVEGYLESASIGLLVARIIAAKIQANNFVYPPYDTVIGALYAFVTKGLKGDFSPMNANLGLLPTVDRKKLKLNKKEKKLKQCELARKSFENYLSLSV